jgi:uncharacterized protein YjiS (DUF1127 family)
MSTMNSKTLSSRRTFWSLVQERVNEWHRRICSRWELAARDQSGLRDIGLSADGADYEASKPFWTA